ncbi:hypothetical protein ACQW02_09070 [Humitalea sp. 24SJ18S-53]|uniref:hypothetical protein n=1 Tax=Humitalea sp. 24SJ18S-53 TaxID=3422307 RepID=UPI003D67CD79
MSGWDYAMTHRQSVIAPSVVGGFLRLDEWRIGAVGCFYPPADVLDRMDSPARRALADLGWCMWWRIFREDCPAEVAHAHIERCAPGAWPMEHPHQLWAVPEAWGSLHLAGLLVPHLQFQGAGAKGPDVCAAMTALRVHADVLRDSHGLTPHQRTRRLALAAFWRCERLLSLSVPPPPIGADAGQDGRPAAA